MKYGNYNLGYGIHISNTIEDSQDLYIPNLYIIQTSIGKINPPEFGSKNWDFNWQNRKDKSVLITDLLNNNEITISEAIEMINRINEEK